MGTSKQCRTCRHYQASPIRGQGWCRNPSLHLPQERHLVGGGELACDRKFHDSWEPVPPPEPVERKPADRQTHWQVVLLTGVGLGIVGLGVGAALLTEGAVPSPTPTPPSIVAAVVLTDTPTPGPTPVPTLPPQVRIANTDGDGAYLRVEPKTGAKGIVAWPDGMELEVLGQATEPGGRAWLNVRDRRGNTGWVPREYTTAGERTTQ